MGEGRGGWERGMRGRGCAGGFSVGRGVFSEDDVLGGRKGARERCRVICAGAGRNGEERKWLGHCGWRLSIAFMMLVIFSDK